MKFSRFSRVISFMLLFAVLVIPPLARAQLYADVGFHGSHLYVGIQPDGEIYSFQLCQSRPSEKCVPITNCKYDREALESAALKISDTAFKDDTTWMFLRSQFSKATLKAFYPNLKVLLELANNSCVVPSFEVVVKNLSDALRL